MQVVLLIICWLKTRVKLGGACKFYIHSDIAILSMDTPTFKTKALCLVSNVATASIMVI